MFRHPIQLLGIVAVSLMVIAAPAQAQPQSQSQEDMSFANMFKLDRLDGNKDRMVSRAEFLAQMGKLWDMKTKQMRITRDVVTEQEMQQILMYMRAGS